MNSWVLGYEQRVLSSLGMPGLRDSLFAFLRSITTGNPNVLYELGIAHMLEKDCIILTKKPNSEMPFDINRISAPPYKDEEQVQQYLRKSISALAFKINR